MKSTSASSSGGGGDRRSRRATTTSLSPAAAAGAASGASSPSHDDDGSASTASKGLRPLSVKVLKLLQEKKNSSYVEIADALVEESVNQVNRQDLSEQERKRLLGDAKNVKRRVYDVLNVLVAMGILEKDRKRLKYVGEPPARKTDSKGPAATVPVTPSTSTTMAKPTRQSSTTTRTGTQSEATDEGGAFDLFSSDVEMLTERVNSKRAQLSSLLVHSLLLHELVKKNEAVKESASTTGEDTKLAVPFIIVSSSPDCHVDVQLSEDKKTMVATFDRSFELHDDVELMTRMNLLDQISEESIRTVVPADLLDLLPPSLKAKLSSQGVGEETTTVSDMYNPQQQQAGNGQQPFADEQEVGGASRKKKKKKLMPSDDEDD